MLPNTECQSRCILQKGRCAALLEAVLRASVLLARWSTGDRQRLESCRLAQRVIVVDRGRRTHRTSVAQRPARRQPVCDSQTPSCHTFNVTMWYTIFTCTWKLMVANLIGHMKPKKQKRVMKQTKSKETRCSKEMVQSNIREVSPEAERESMVEKICERGRSWAGSERERELWMVRVLSWQRQKMW